jgi:hypothetical protein
MEPLLPRRGPLRHVPTPADQPRVLFPRSRYGDRDYRPLRTVVLRTAVMAAVLALLGIGGIWGWRAYEAQQAYIELWRDVELFPAEATTAQREALEQRIEEARSRLSESKWTILHAAWESQKSRQPDRQITGTPSRGAMGN